MWVLWLWVKHSRDVRNTAGVLHTSWFAESPSDGLNPYCSWSTPSQLPAFTASISALSKKNLAGQKPQPRSRAATAATIRPQQHAGNVFYSVCIWFDKMFIHRLYLIVTIYIIFDTLEIWWYSMQYIYIYHTAIYETIQYIFGTTMGISWDIYLGTWEYNGILINYVYIYIYITYVHIM